jgi:XTP/dITP diphosphohydrolase
MTDILFATTNPHKVEELAAILAPVGFVVLPLSGDHAAIPEPPEDQDTFEGNARLKALYYARATGIVTLAEDSGLEVDALGGAPGVHSARYAGIAGTRAEKDRANNAKLLAELGAIPAADRTARFVCALALATPQGEIIAEARGTYDGIIADEPRGSNGFGYDPLLFLPDIGRTSAELTPEAKNARSHRGKAGRALASTLRARPPRDAG